MPTVQAADPPYTGKPTISPTFVETPGFRITATPEAFGAGVGRAVSGLGEQFARAGDLFATDAIARQQIFNQVTADDQTNKYAEEETKILYGDPAKKDDRGFYGLSGEEAVRAWPGVRDQITNLRSTIRGNLQNDQQRLLFDRETRYMQQQAFRVMGNHYDTQFKAYTEGVNKATQDLKLRQIATAAADQAAVDNYTKELIDAGYKDLQIRGLAGDDNAVWDMEAKARSDAAQQQIDALTASATTTADLARAQEVYQNAIKNQVPFTGAHHEAIRRMLDAAQARLEKAEEKKQIDEQTRRIMGGGGGGAGGGGNRQLVSYTPSTDVLQGTGLSGAEYDTFRHYLASREASGYGERPNAGGYMGQYQMGPQEIADTAKRLGVPTPTQAEFLSNPDLQEKFFDNYTLDHHNTLMRESEKYRNASPQERAAILAGAHLGGTTGVQRYLDQGKDAADSNGTTISNYVTSMRKAMAAPAPPPAATSAAPTKGDESKLEVRGDSLGVGMKTALGVGGHAVGGLQPKAILDDILKEPKEHWAGQTVVLSAGSNGNDLPTVEKTIQYLKDNQANVVVIGLANQPEKSARLNEIAGRLGVPVVPPEDTGRGIHPSAGGYNSMAKKVRTAMRPEAP